MKKEKFGTYIRVIITFTAFFVMVTPLFQPISLSQEHTDTSPEKALELPDPMDLTIPLEEAICRRMSVRDFTGEEISPEELSTILWYAYGKSPEGQRNIHGITDEYPITIYVLDNNGVWRYDPENHELINHRRSDMTWIGQYDTAAVKIGLIWDTNKCVDENYAGAEIGEICQNIYFTCNALNLGTVTTASEVNQLYFIGLPAHETPRIIMPIGPPNEPYHFTYDPLQSNLPIILNSTTSLGDAIKNRGMPLAWEETDLTLQEQIQIIWSSYGYSYYIDELNNKRHKTVPSSHGTYPLTMYCINKTGIYRYKPDSHQLLEIKKGDYRGDIADTSEHFIATAPLLLLPVLNTTDRTDSYIWVWFYEAAAAAYNVLLESTAWNLSSNIMLTPDTDMLNTILGLNLEKWLPLFIIPVGKPKPIENQPPNIIITQPKNGLYIFGKKIVNIERTVIAGPFQATIETEDDCCFKAVHIYIDGKAIEYGNNQLTTFSLPRQFYFRPHELTGKAYDYGGESTSTSIEYTKIF